MPLTIRSLAVAACAAVLAVPAAEADAAGVSHQIPALEAAAADARTALAADAARAKVAGKVVSLLARKSNARSLADELRSVASAARLAEGKLADQQALLDAFASAVPGYESDLRTAQEALAAAAASDQVKAKLRKRYEKAAARIGALLPAKRAATPLADRFSALAGGAAAAKGFTPYDSGVTYDWVLSDFALAPNGQGVDLTGDGRPDNVIASLTTLLGGAVDVGSLFGSVSQGGRYGLLEMWYAQDLAKGDPFVFAGLLGGTDADGDPANDLSGTGAFAPVPESLAADGRPLVRVASGVARGGKYRIDFSGQAVTLGTFELPATARVVVEATATPESNDGLIGVAIPSAVLQQILADQGVTLSGLQLLLFNGLADVDTDGNGSKDAFSAAFAFESVKATVVR
jgi:hypothetical protein